MELKLVQKVMQPMKEIELLEAIVEEAIVTEVVISSDSFPGP